MGAQISEIKSSSITDPTQSGSNMNGKPKTSLDLFMENVKLEENSP